MRSFLVSPHGISRVIAALNCSVREDGDEVEFVTLLRFDSMDAVKEFAGADASKPVIFAKAEALIARMEPARHYRVAI